MATRLPTVKEVIKAISIYKGTSEESVLSEIKNYAKERHHNSLVNAGLDFGIMKSLGPTSLYPEICELNRKLNDYERDALMLRDEIKRKKVSGIHIKIDGLTD